MECGVSVSKQIHLDERLEAFTWLTYNLFPMGFVRALPGVSRCFLHTCSRGRTSWHPVLPLLFTLRERYTWDSKWGHWAENWYLSRD